MYDCSASSEDDCSASSAASSYAEHGNKESDDPIGSANEFLGFVGISAQVEIQRGFLQQRGLPVCLAVGSPPTEPAKTKVIRQRRSGSTELNHPTYAY